MPFPGGEAAALARLKHYLWDSDALGTYFETVLRLFRFANQTEGDAYLRSAHPVFYLRASHGEGEDRDARGDDGTH